MAEDLMNVEDVCEALNITSATISNWYKFKAENPAQDICSLLPEIVRVGPRNARYWRRQDLDALRKFKKAVPRGCHGIMGAVTQRYVRSKKTEE